MSTTKRNTVLTCEYSECENEGEKWQFTDGRFCSTECKNRDDAGSIYNLLKHDHRYCFSCLSQLKEVSRPTDEQLRKVQGKHSAEAICGFQYRTPNADTGEITIRADVIDTVAKGTVCGNCGTTDHTDEFMRDFEPVEAAKRLRKRVQETKAEGQHNYDFRTQDFVEAWNESHDWLLSLGKALE